MGQRTKATIDDLYRVPDNAKAELVNGELVVMAPTGGTPGYAGDEIFAALRDYCRQSGYGRAIGDNKGFRVHLPNRESFSPDAALWVGPPPGMRLYEGAPCFAAEVRSEGDYGEMHASCAELDEEQDVDGFQEEGFDREEVAGQNVILMASEEATPGTVPPPLGCWRQAVALEDGADGRVSEAMTDLGQLTLDAPVAPAGIIPR